MKKALVMISFGTADPAALSSITTLEQTVSASLPDYQCFRCFTSRTIIRILKQRQQLPILTPPEMMEFLIQNGYQEVICQPLHIIPGIEYERMKDELLSFAPSFQSFMVGSPLLWTQTDYDTCCQAVLAHMPLLKEQEALILMGHGTEHFAHAAYAQLETTFRYTGHSNILVSTVEGFPSIRDLLPILRQKKIHHVYLMPFMIVAGEHAKHDMAGTEPDSWKSILSEAGYSVTPILTGLGEWDEIGQLVTKHLKEALS